MDCAYEIYLCILYKFGKKKLYITDTDKHTFQEENIRNIMNHTDQKEIINKLCNSFFIDR